MPVGGKSCVDGSGNTAMIGEPHVVGRVMRATFGGWLRGCRAGSIGVDLCAVEETHHHVRQTQRIFGWRRGDVLWEGGILPMKYYGSYRRCCIANLCGHYHDSWPLLQNVVRQVYRPPVLIHATTGPIRNIIRSKSAAVWNRDHTRYVAFEIANVVTALLCIHL